MTRWQRLIPRSPAPTIRSANTTDDPLIIIDRRQRIAERGVVLLAHSLGGYLALEALAGACGPRTALGGAPPLACAAALAAPLPAAGCARGRGDGARARGILRGAAVWEGYAAAGSRWRAAPGTFALVMASPQNNATREFFEQAAAALHGGNSSRTVVNGSSSSGGVNSSSGGGGGDAQAAFCRAGCVTYAAFPSTGHFGITNGGAPTACHSRGGASDPPGFAIAPAEQAAALEAAAALIDAHVRAFALGDAAARARLQAMAAATAAAASGGRAAPAAAAARAAVDGAKAAAARRRGARAAGRDPGQYAPLLAAAPACF